MSAESEGCRAAEQFRRDHGLGFQPLGDLVSLIEHTIDADVAVLDTEADQHGMTMRREGASRVYIAVARTRRAMRQRSTLAHELAHVVFGDWQDEPRVESADPIESRANAFARHLLLPKEGLRDVVADDRGGELATLSEVVQRFLVSPPIAAIALEQNGYIGQSTKERWKTETTQRLAVRFGWLDQYRALQDETNTRRAPQKLLARAISGWLQNVVSIEAVAVLRGLDAATVEKELIDAGLEPAARTVDWSGSEDLPEVDIDLAELDAVLRAGEAEWN